MKKLLFTLTTVLCSVFNLIGQVAGDYQSNGAVSFTAATNWQKYDGAMWAAAGTFPTAADGTITIQAGHTASYLLAAGGIALDQLVIKGTLIYMPSAAPGIMTIADGAGDDIVIESGGILRQTTTASSTFPIITSGATVRVKTGGMIEATTTAGSSINWASDVVAATASAMIWEDNAVFLWNNNSNFSTSNRIYFPNATTTIPIFRVGGTLSTVGANSIVTFNGIFEVASGASIDWSNGTANRTFRNGIRNSGSFLATTTTANKWIITGTTAVFGGTGTFRLPLNGLEIVAGSTVTLENDITVTPNSASSTILVNGVLKLGAGNLTLGINNLTVGTTGSITMPSATSHIVTNSTGSVKFQNVQATPVTFPIGISVTSYDPVIIDNSAGTADEFSVSVSSTVPYAPSSTTKKNNIIARAWDINEAVAGGSSVILSLTAGALTNLNGTAFTNSASVVLGHGNGLTYDIIPATYSAGTFTSSGFVTTFSPFIAANDVALPVELSNIKGSVFGKKNRIEWTVNSELNIDKYTIERSTKSNKEWVAVGEISSKGNSTKAENYSFEDNAPECVGYYRLRVKDFSGKNQVSNVVSLAQTCGRTAITALSPSPAREKITIQFESLTEKDVTFNVMDMTGKIVLQSQTQAKEGINYQAVDISALASGLYIIRFEDGSLNQDVFKFTKIN